MKIFPEDIVRQNEGKKKKQAETEKIMRWIALAAAFAGVFIFFFKLLFF